MDNPATLRAPAILCTALAALLATLPAPGPAQPLDDYTRCVMELVGNAADDVTVAEIRHTCEPDSGTAAPPAPTAQVEDAATPLEKRLAMESATDVIPFVITPHKPNYLIASYNTLDYKESLFEQQFNENVSLKNAEVDFQISFKFPAIRGIFNTRTNLYFSYTNRSFWQVFDRADSAPFRETNHEPEVWLAIPTRFRFLGFDNRLVTLGIVHQSNGRGGVLSRSWNRVYTTFVFERGNLAFALKPWLRLQESRNDDDNPDIEDYMGYFEFLSVYKHGRQSVDMLVRNTLRDDYRGALQLGYTFPIKKHVHGYVQYFHGYGESLIDYDHKVRKLGLGIKLTDWL